LVYLGPYPFKIHEISSQYLTALVFSLMWQTVISVIISFVTRDKLINLKI